MRSAISPSLAGRNGSPSVFVSFVSLTRWSPRTTTMTIPRPSVTIGKAFSSAPAGTPICPATASIVVAPGVWTFRGAGSGSGSATGCGSALATSTFAA